MKPRPIKMDPEHDGAEGVVESMTQEMEGVFEELLQSAEEDGQILVRRRYKNGGVLLDEEEDLETIAVRPFACEPARAGLRVNHTLNLGNFYSLSVQVHVDVPCYREEFEDAYAFVKAQVEEKLGEALEEGINKINEFRGTGDKKQSPHPF